MLCKKCGNKMDDDARFCPICGNKSEVDNLNKCPRCDSLIIKNFKYCKTCGYNLEESEATAEIYSSEQGITDEFKFEQNKRKSNEIDINKLQRFHLISLFIMIFTSVLVLVSLFLPLFQSVNTENIVNEDYAKLCFYFDSQVEHINISNNTEVYGSINIISVVNLLFAEISKIDNTFFTDTLLNHTGVFIYSFLLFAYLVLAITALTSLVICIIGIIKKNYSLKLKHILAAYMTTALILLAGLGCDGIAIAGILLASLLGFIWFYLSELLSKEKRFRKNKFIIKGCVILLMSAFFVLLCLPTIQTTTDFSTLFYFDLHDSELTGNGLSQVILQMAYITNPKYTGNVTNVMVWLSSVSLFVYGGFIVLFSLCVSQIFISFTSQNVAVPIKKMWVAALLLIVFFLLNYGFTNFVNSAEYALLNTGNVGQVISEDDELLNQSKIIKLPASFVASIICVIPLSIATSVGRWLCFKTK